MPRQSDGRDAVLKAERDCSGRRFGPPFIDFIDLVKQSEIGHSRR